MEDYSYLDRKYFVDEKTYNCPYCNRNNIPYNTIDSHWFDWSGSKGCYAYFVRCSFCRKISMHLSFTDIRDSSGGYKINQFESGVDIDSHIFYSVPTSFFTMDSRVPEVIRELITEAEGCIKMNFLTGASACTRKAIYEFLIKEKAEGKRYEDKIEFIKKKYKDCDPALFDILGRIQGITSDKVHEQSWPKWNSKHLKLLIETLKAVLYEIYVEPKIKEARSTRIKELQGDIKPKKTERPQGQK